MSLAEGYRTYLARVRGSRRPDASFEAVGSSAEIKFPFRLVAVSTTISTRLSHAEQKIHTRYPAGCRSPSGRARNALEGCAELGECRVDCTDVCRVCFYEEKLQQVPGLEFLARCRYTNAGRISALGPLSDQLTSSEKSVASGLISMTFAPCRTASGISPAAG